MPDTVRSLGEEAKDLLEAAASKIDEMVELAEEQEGEGGGIIDPEPPEPGGGGEFEGVPSGPNDARFANCRPRSRIDAKSGVFEDFEIRDQSGEPLIQRYGYTCRRFKLYGREGIRIAGANILCEDFYAEIAGAGDDHGDGVQGYTGGGTSPNCVFRRGKLIMTSGANNCAWFLADNCRTGLILEDIWVEDRGGCPHGACWFPNNGPNDTGIVEVGYRNVNLLGQKYPNGGIDIIRNDSVKPKILFWDNVWANGSEVPRPSWG
jgi:hypothetical protein